jgi:hypothetical protein
MINQKCDIRDLFLEVLTEECMASVSAFMKKARNRAILFLKPRSGEG